MAGKAQRRRRERRRMTGAHVCTATAASNDGQVTYVPRVAYALVQTQAQDSLASERWTSKDDARAHLNRLNVGTYRLLYLAYAGAD